MNVALRLLKMKMFARIGRFVQTAFSQKYLLYTNVAISMSLSGAGDVIEQTHEIVKGDLEKLNLTRTNHMTLTGLTVGILTHYWYRFLDKGIPGKTIQIVMKKIVIDQIVISPIAIATFFGTLCVLEGTPFEEYLEDCKQKGWRLYAAEWMIWPPAQFINFYFLPHRFRVLYDSTISLGFDIYSSYVVHMIPLEEHSENSSKPEKIAKSS